MTRTLAAALALSLGASAHAADVTVGVAVAGNLRISNPSSEGEFVNPVASETGSLGGGIGGMVPIRIHVNELAAARVVTHVHYTQGAVAFSYEGSDYRYLGAGLVVGETLGGEMAFSDADTRPYLFGEFGGGLLRFWPRTSDANPASRDAELCVLRDTVNSCDQPPDGEIHHLGATAMVNLGLGIAAGDVMRIELGYLRGRPVGNAVNQSATGVELLDTTHQALQLSVGVALGG